MVANKIGIVAFSFSLRDVEPNPCNVHLAEAVMRAVDQYSDVYGRDNVVVVTQWEIALWLKRLGISPDLVVHPPVDGSYLDSDGIWAQAQELFTSQNIEEVISIEQPFLQRHKNRGMIRKAGFTIVPFDVGNIGFDPESNQWWCRSRFRLLQYAIKQVLFKKRGFDGQQQAA